MLYIAQRQLGYPWFWISSVLILLLITSLSSFSLQFLLVLGLGLGATLNYFLFGFTSAWRSLVLDKKTEGVRAQVWMIGFASLLFAPLLLLGAIGELPYQGLIRPISLSVVVGAFLFGLGMQLAGSCSSGTLNRVGQLQSFSFVTFIFLLVGGVIGAYLYGSWVNWPTLPPYSFNHALGGGGLVFNLALLYLAYRFFVYYEQKNHGHVSAVWQINNQAWWLVKQSPLLTAGLILALLNFFVFSVSGQPWSIASVFAIWGIKLSDWINLGLDWPFWEITSLYGTRLDRPVLEDPVSLTTLGVILGALLITLLKNASSPREAFRWSRLSSAITGGLLMGFGATLSYGCNIGAFFSGIASGSLHGWVWIIFAVLGNIAALKLIMRK